MTDTGNTPNDPQRPDQRPNPAGQEQQQDGAEHRRSDDAETYRQPGEPVETHIQPGQSLTGQPNQQGISGAESENKRGRGEPID